MKVARKLWTWALALVATFALVLGLSTVASAAAGDTPPHTKNITDNQDGTYTISLDIVGESEKKPNNVNVIVIFDTSGSMTTQRMNAAKNAVNSLANSLYAYNTSTDPDTVEMALVQFATSSTIAQNPTTSQTTFTGAVNRLGNAQGAGTGGTNWESALQTALNVDFGDEDQTFVVFVSDGNPTFRTTQNGWNDWSYQYQQWGTGAETNQNIQRCYTTAVDDAQALATKVTPANFFTIGAFGNVDRMEQLTDDAGSDSSTNYYSAQNTAALNQAIADILAKIEMAGFADAEINDGTTSQVTTTSGEVAHLLVVDESSYKYYRTGGDHGTMEPWTDAPEAHLVDGTVEWDLSEVGVLENGVRYTVTFDCYPSQTTYDIIAQLKNGDLKYSELDSEIQKYIVDNGNGSYSLRTNTNAGIAWDDTRDDAGRQTSGYTNPDPVKTESSTLTATKEWEGGDPDVKELEITVLMGDEAFHSATISADNGWSTSSFISPGIIKGGQVLPGAEGHDFKFAELGSEQYHWELESPVVHPMLIDGELTMLIMVDKNHPQPSDATTYTINGNTYYVDTDAAGLTAVNHRRSNLNLTKVVTGEDAPEDAKFPFELTVNNSKAPATAPEDDPEHNSDYWVWLSVRDENGQGVTGLSMGSGVVEDSGGYYYAPSGTTFSLEIGADWSLRFLNLPTGTTYTFAEGTLPEGFAFNKAELTQGEDSTFNGAQTTTGTIENTKTSYTVTYTNDYQLTDLEITKVWEDNDNQDGMRLTAAQLAEKLTLSPAVQGKEPTVTDNGDGTYTITYTGLPRFSNGQEVEYTVAESAIDGYTTTGSPAKDHGTIKNTHTPETTSVTVVKEWADDNNIGGIRPTSIQAQLTADGTASGDPVTLNAGNEWTYTWENLPVYKNGTEIVYSADETEVPTGYTKSGPEKTTADDGTITFTVTNTYSPTPVTASFTVDKEMIVPEGLEGPEEWSYTINVAANGDAPTVQTMSREIDQDNPSATFGAFTFTKPGTYTYTVTESGEVDGVTNDPSTGKTVTITVVDNGSGVLTATVKGADSTSDETTDKTTFKNTYSVEPTTAEIPAKKVLTVPEGLEGPEDASWTFELVGADGAPMPTTTSYTVEPDQTVTFGTMSYSAPGTYTYTVSETGSVDGVTNDSEASGKTVTVTVTDNGDGTLSASVSPEAGVTFTNVYSVNPATIELKAGKKLEVEPPADNPPDVSGKYTLTLTASGDAPMPEGATDGKVEITNTDGNGTMATFGEISYTAPGEYQYTVSESGEVAGVTNGQTSYTVVVSVTDNGDGTLTATVKTGSQETLFTNTYKVVPVTLETGFEVTKDLTGTPLTAGAFEFVLTAVDGAPMPEKTEATNDADGKVVFDVITYEKPGTYKYTITEKDGGKSGYGYDDMTVDVAVEVKDNSDGTLVATVTYSSDTEFNNTYTAEGEFTPTVSKKLNGRALEADQFSFELVDEDGNVIETVKNNGSGAVQFTTIEYDQTIFYGDAATTDDSTDTPESNGAVPVIIDEVADDEAAEPASEDEAVVDEIDEPAADEPAADEIVVDEPAAEEPAADEPTEDGFDLLDTLANFLGLRGLFKPTIALAEGTERVKTFIYTIREVNDGKPGYTYDGHEVTVTVTVTDKGDGTLDVQSEYSGSTEFVNTYKAKGSVSFGGVKTVTTETSKKLEEGQFTFQLKDADNAVLQEKTNAADGTFTFDELSYTEADAGKEYTYQIVEVNDGKTGYTYDDHICTVTVNVEDNGDGTLTCIATLSDGEQAAFDNPYEPLATSAPFKGTKTIEGKTLQDGEFTFELKDSEGTVVATATNKADGSIDFGTLEFKKEGTFTFTATEVVPSEPDPNMTYDTAEHTYTVEVVDNNGQLEATVTGEDGELVKFENEYVPEPVTYDPPVQKVIQGNPEKPETFTFQMKAVTEGAPMPDGSADGIKTIQIIGAGSMEFGDMEFTEPGEWVYQITELKGSADGYTYDSTVYTLTVTVTQNADGTLVDTETFTGGSSSDTAVFTNVYKPSTPKTGDTTPQVGMLALAGVVITGIAAFGARRRED